MAFIWKLMLLLACGVAADSYLEAFTHSQGGAFPPPGVVFMEPTPQPQQLQQFAGNHYLPPPQPSEWSLPYNLKIDPGSIIPIGLSVATVLKLILKIMIFKMIIKFMAVMCLLLVIPALQKQEPTTTTTTTTSTEAPSRDGKEYIIEAATTKPTFCDAGDWPCYIWEKVANKSSTKRSSRKRRQSAKNKNR